MAKTRRTKQNRSPGRAYRNAKTYIVEQGDKVTTIGIRGRTKVKRVTDEAGKRLTSIRVVEEAVQTPAKGVGDLKPKGVFVGRVYTGVARSKPYPYRSVKRGAVPVPQSKGLLARARRAVKRVVVGEVA
jgi:hypothetical protein